MAFGLRFGIQLASLAAITAITSCASRGAIEARGAPDDTPSSDAAAAADALSSNETEAAGAAKEPSAEAAAAPSDGRARIWAVQGFAKVLADAKPNAALIGLVRAGQGVPLVTGKPLAKAGLGHCKNGWYEVVPRGVICLNDLSTLDPKDPRVGAARLALPDVSRELPFFVGTSIGAPMYARIPTRAEQEANEPGLQAHLGKTLPADDALGGAIDRAPAGSGPPAEYARWMRETKPRLLADESAYAGRRIAWTREFDAEGRTWLLTADLGLVPKDKVRTKPASELSGVDLTKPGAPKLPLAYTWLGDVKKFRRDASGVLAETDEVWPRHTFFEIQDHFTRGPGGLYYKAGDDAYVRNDLVTVIKKKDGRPPAVGKKEKWIHVRVTWGWMVAYEGDTPVYTTAISPGMDGITERPQGHTTKRGIHPVGWKLFSADMNGVDKGKEWAVDEVPFVGYYKASYGLHGAYWHDDFGRPKSHGCINIAPRDARWLFGWMDPAMPEGWYAVAAVPGLGVPFTWVDVRP
jgi:hypothetical protein